MVQDLYVKEAFISEIQQSCDTIGSVVVLTLNICFAHAFSMFFVFGGFLHGF